LIESWIDFAANEVEAPVDVWLGPVEGRFPFDQEANKKAIADVRKVLVSLDAYFVNKTFLVRDRLSLADIVLATALLPGYRVLFDPGFRKAFKNTNRWFSTCINQPHFVDVLGKVDLCDKKPPAPKKEEPKKQEQPKKEQPKAAKPAADDDDDGDIPAAAEEKKVKPFSHLPPTKFNMNDFKVAYSNEDTRSVALPHLYQHFEKQGWSLYFVEYKYPEDLQKLFMVSNLLGGFCQRAEGIRDFVCGSLLIFGEENNYEIHGAILLRGAEWPAAEMADIPDTESYKWTKIDLETVSAEDKEFFDDLWAWEGKFKGKKFTEAGKVMK